MKSNADTIPQTPHGSVKPLEIPSGQEAIYTTILFSLAGILGSFRSAVPSVYSLIFIFEVSTKLRTATNIIGTIGMPATKISLPNIARSTAERARLQFSGHPWLLSLGSSTRSPPVSILSISRMATYS
jgi:hypothetical protein